MVRYEAQSPNLKDDFAGTLNVYAPNGAPSLPIDGYAFPSQQDVLIVTMEVDGTPLRDSADFQIWLYRIDSGNWVLWGDAGVVSVVAGTAADTVEVRGYAVSADRVYVEVVSVTGTPTACNAWVFGATASRGV